MQIGLTARFLAGLVVCLGCTPALASVPAPTGQIVGTFSDPIYSGSVLNAPVLGQRTFYDNSSTAPATTFINGNILTWGTNTGNPFPGTDYSTLTFSGATVPYADQTSPTILGTISYTNGTSALNSLIFGAKLTFSINGIVLGSDQIIITTTSNQSSGTNLTQAQAQLDADYINICGAGSNICGQGIQAYENTQGMNGTAFSTPVLAQLTGTYQVDPSISLTDVSYLSGDGTVGTRFQGAVPETSTWLMLLLGFAGLGIAGYRSSRRDRVSAAFSCQQ